jgi:hypothetical protein
VCGLQRMKEKERERREKDKLIDRESIAYLCVFE